ncbi:MAG: response regulator transcription factor [Sulfurimonas sp.]|nr:response regulator transcription factor [Sulfurimonas sp.]
MVKILLMEDDAVLSSILLDYLRESWQVDYAYNTQEVYVKLENIRYDLFIFDINVVGQSGLELLKELREFNNTTPTIIITAYTDTDYLKQAFEFGACDYVKKPFDLEELNARILNTKTIFNIQNDTQIEISHNIYFNISKKQIINNDEIFTISAKDSKILEYFLKNQKRVITAEELTQNIWDFDNMPSDATVRSHIRTLRELIGKNKINTIRGSGYTYE